MGQLGRRRRARRQGRRACGATTTGSTRSTTSGTHFRVAGPLNVPRSPQGHPLLVQAGSSEDGQGLRRPLRRGGLHRPADARPTPRRSTPTSRRGPRPLGRDPDQLIKILPGIVPAIGATEAEARALEAGARPADPAGVRPRAARHAPCGSPPSGSPLDEQLPADLPDEDEIEGAKSRYTLIVTLARRERLTVRQLIGRLGGGRGHRTFAGTPEQVADAIEEWFDQRRRRRLQHHAAGAAVRAGDVRRPRRADPAGRAACSAPSTPAPPCATTTGWPARPTSTPATAPHRTIHQGDRMTTTDPRPHRRPGQPADARRDELRRLGQPRPRRVDPDHPPGARRGHQRHRHRRRLLPRRVGGDRRQGAQGAPRRRRPGHQVPRPCRRRPQPSAATRAAGSSGRSRTRCAGSRPTRSTSTRCTGRDPDIDIDETLGALSDLVHAGKIRYIGTSTFLPSQIVEAQWVARDRAPRASGDRAAAVHHPGPRGRARGAADRRAARPRRAAVEPAGRRLAVRPLPPRTRRAGRLRAGPSGSRPATTRRRRRTRPSWSAVDELPGPGRRGRGVADPPGARLRAEAPGGHVGDHRAAHARAAGVAARARTRSTSPPTCSTASTRSCRPARPSTRPTGVTHLRPSPRPRASPSLTDGGARRVGAR